MAEKLLTKQASKQAKPLERAFLKDFRFYYGIGRKTISIDAIVNNHRLGNPKICL